MRPFVAFILTSVALGLFLVLYHPDFIVPYEHPPGVSVNIYHPHTMTPVQAGEVIRIKDEIAALNLADVSVGGGSIWSLPIQATSYVKLIEVAAAFAITTPLFVVYGLLNWIIKIIE